MHTLTMHSDSVWSLYSPDPHLNAFYSSDRSGLIVKTDVSGTSGEMDDGLSLAVAQESEGVSRVVASGGFIWAATSSSSINRWTDVDTAPEDQPPSSHYAHRALTPDSQATATAVPKTARSSIPLQSILRISNTASFVLPLEKEPDTLVNMSGRKGAEAAFGTDLNIVLPAQEFPQHTIDGQHGFIKHKILNDKQRVLTVDTADEVMLWDLMKVCLCLLRLDSGMHG